MSEHKFVPGKELKELMPPFFYFLVVFHLLSATQGVMSGRSGSSLLRSSVALVAALTVAKSILLIDLTKVSRRYDEHPLIYPILWKTLLFGTMTCLFHVLEEFISHTRHAGWSASLGWQHMVEEMTVPRSTVLLLWLFCSTLVFTAAREVFRRFGRQRAIDALFREPAPAGRSEG